MTIPNPTEAPMANAIDDVKEWVLVPKEPTKAMKMAIAAADWQGSSDLNWDDGYKIMIAAAPPYPAPSQHTGWSDEEVEVKRGNFIAVTSDEPQLSNFHTAIYEDDYDGLLIALCNQNGRYPWQATAMLKGLNSKADEVNAALSAASSIAPATGFEVGDLRSFFLLTQELKELEKSYHERSTDVHDRWETADRQEFSDVDAAAREIDGKRQDIMRIEARIRSSITPSAKGGEPLFTIRDKTGEEPCGECHLQPGETCDICNATASISPSVAKESGEPLPNPSPSDGEVSEALTVPARDGLEAQRGLNDIFPGDPYPVHDQLKRGLDKLRAEASRGAVSSRQIFTMTDPLMDILSRSSRALQSKRGQP